MPLFGVGTDNDHATMVTEGFYELEEGGVRWVDWLTGPHQCRPDILRPGFAPTPATQYDVNGR